ncbi:hypothetical protein Cgig2_024979 [Carnegiea gigantea]|uniref:Uncharacterized protein n=1 Tax=Carnegiea gigantea TaxID=171969 RepID=A0A9Q1JRL5_9CARY|nr:hypothetical protein Cgig2_024979 [Carnegiea gigantea]
MPSYSLGLGLSQPDSQSPVPQNTSVPDPSTTVVNEDDGIEDDDGSAPFRIPLRSTSQVNRELSAKKPAEKKPKEGDEPACKKLVEHNKGSHRASGEQVATDSRKPKLTKGVLPKKHDEKHLGAARTPEMLEELTKHSTELSQDELTISDDLCSMVAVIRRPLGLLWSL